MLAAFRSGLDKKLELLTDDNDIRNKNPLGKIPIIEKPDGDCLFDSRVIIDHFNREGGGLIPVSGKDRDIVLTRSALAEGIIDASLLVVYSDRYAGGEVPSKMWLDMQIEKIDKSLDFLELDVVNWYNPLGFDAANIGLASALGYLTFRNVRDWKTNRPNIQKWYEDVAFKLPGFNETMPVSP
jgi:glutathione S-transferase